ncbi:MAG: DUF1439 domain-containing protein [Janthinobacterium lividum]
MKQSPASPRRRGFLLAWGGGLGASWLLSALVPGAVARAQASIFPFIPDQYTFSRAQVQSVVARKFPYRRRMEGLFELVLANPRVSLLPDTNRLGIAFDAQVTSTLLAQPFNGSFALDSALVYDATRLAVVLRDPRLVSADFSQLGGDLAQQLGDAAGVLAKQLLDGYPVYQFKPDQLSFAGVHYAPGAITVVPSGVKVQIVEQ